MNVVRYDQLVANAEGTLRDVQKFLNVEEYDVMKAYNQRRETMAKKDGPPPPDQHVELRKWQLSQKLYDGRGRWETERSHNERQIFKDIAGDMLIRYGYADSKDW